MNHPGTVTSMEESKKVITKTKDESKTGNSSKNRREHSEVPESEMCTHQRQSTTVNRRMDDVTKPISGTVRSQQSKQGAKQTKHA